MWGIKKYFNKKPDDCPDVGNLPKDDDQPDWRGIKRKDVIELPMPPPDTNYRQLDHYFWFDTPDYADPFKKLGYVMRWNLSWGFIGYGLYGLLSKGSYKFDVPTHARILRKFYIPFCVANLACGSTIIILSNLRGKKDDLWNYVAGGLVGCSILGRNSYVTLTNNLISYLPLIVYTKYNAEINGCLLPVENVRTLYNHNIDMRAKGGFPTGNFMFGTNVYPDPGRDLR